MPEYYSYTLTRWEGEGEEGEGELQLDYLARIVTAIGAQGQFLMCFAMTVEIVGNK